MNAYTVVQGDDEEFALQILDPVTGNLVDMSTHTDWLVELQWKSSLYTLSKSYTGGTLLVNSGSSDLNAPDGSVRILLDKLETAAMTPGRYALWTRVTDSGTEVTHLEQAGIALNVVSSPLNT